MGVIFDEGGSGPTRQKRDRTPLITKMVMKTGLAKTSQGARLVMLIITIAAIAGVVFLFPQVTKEPPLPNGEGIRSIR